MTTFDERFRTVNLQFEVTAKVIAQQVGATLAEAGDDPVVVKHAGETLFAYLHEQSATLEVMLLAIGVDEDVLDALVDSCRGDVPMRAAELRDRATHMARAH